MARPFGWLLLVWIGCVQAQSPATFSLEPATQTVTLSGFTRARATQAVAVEIAGRCREVFADIGDPIPENGLFACLDNTFIALDRKANRIEQERLKTELRYYQKEVTRQQKLIRRNSGVESELDRLRFQADNLRHQIQARAVEAEILAERDQRHCLAAPPGWKVIERAIEPGQWVNTGQIVAKVGDYQALLVPLALAEAEFAALQASPNPVLTLASDGSQHPVKRFRVAPNFDPITRKTQVDLAITGPAPRGGQRMLLQLLLPAAQGIFQVPATAVLENYGEAFLFRPDGQREKVLLLQREEASIRVSAPALHPGERILRQAPIPTRE